MREDLIPRRYCFCFHRLLGNNHLRCCCCTWGVVNGQLGVGDVEELCSNDIDIMEVATCWRYINRGQIQIMNVGRDRVWETTASFKECSHCCRTEVHVWARRVDQENDIDGLVLRPLLHLKGHESSVVTSKESSAYRPLRCRLNPLKVNHAKFCGNCSAHISFAHIG